MAVTSPPRRPRKATRRFGYLVAVAIDVSLLLVVNAWPGWESVPFLTDDTAGVIGVLNLLAVVIAGLAVGVVVDAVALAREAGRSSVPKRARSNPVGPGATPRAEDGRDARG